MPSIDVVADANVVVKWFHAAGEEGIESARALLAAHGDRRVAMVVLDLTAYEVGNALLRGGAHPAPGAVATVLEALARICAAIAPAMDDLRRAAELAAAHGLTLYDAAYAAVAERRGGQLATFDARLLESGLGRTPADVLAGLV